jgi:hypothetical protein
VDFPIRIGALLRCAGLNAKGAKEGAEGAKVELEVEASKMAEAA